MIRPNDAAKFAEWIRLAKGDVALVYDAIAISKFQSPSGYVKEQDIINHINYNVKTAEQTGMKIIQAPNEYWRLKTEITLFLGGSIEQGKARNWQAETIEFLKVQPYADNLVVYNPRRDDWDASWSNTAEFEPFKEQVIWELKYQELGNYTHLNTYYFCEGTLSPITLLEAGLHGNFSVVGMDEAYPRRGNLEITADFYSWDISIGFDNYLKSLDKELLKNFDLLKIKNG